VPLPLFRVAIDIWLLPKSAVIIVATVGVLLYLHFRRRRLDRHEDARHAHELTDYDDDDMMPQPPVKKPDGAVVTGYGNGRMGGGRPPPPGYSSSDARSARDADQFGSSVDSVVGGGGGPQTKNDPFADRSAGGGLR